MPRRSAFGLFLGSAFGRSFFSLGFCNRSFLGSDFLGRSFGSSLGGFFGFSLLGSLLWIGGLLTLGYLFGNVPFIKDNLTLLIFGIIGLSLIPMLIGYLRHRR